MELSDLNSPFDSKGGSYTPDAQAVTAGKLVTMPDETPGKTGYVFGNWYYLNEGMELRWQFRNYAVTKDITFLQNGWNRT